MTLSPSLVKNPELDSWLRRHTTPMPSRPTRFSKYTVGMQTLLGV